MEPWRPRGGPLGDPWGTLGCSLGTRGDALDPLRVLRGSLGRLRALWGRLGDPRGSKEAPKTMAELAPARAGTSQDKSGRAGDARAYRGVLLDHEVYHLYILVFSSTSSKRL